MRFTQVLNRRWPKRQVYENTYPFEIPFQSLYPLELKDRYTDQQRIDRERPCVPQLTVLLQCFKDSDFNQTRCAESLKAYYACVAEHSAKNSSEVKSRKLTDVKRTKDLTQLEATKLLKMKPLMK